MDCHNPVEQCICFEPGRKKIEITNGNARMVLIPTTPVTDDLKTGGQTPTPRTDAEASQYITPDGCWADFARTLERELTEANTLIVLQDKNMSHAAQEYIDLNEKLTKALAAHAADRAMLETRAVAATAMAARVIAEKDHEIRERKKMQDRLAGAQSVAFQSQKAAKDLMAQLDAARREREIAEGVRNAALESQQAAVKARDEIINSGKGKLWKRVFVAEHQRDALRAELEAVKAISADYAHTIATSVSQLADLRAQLDAERVKLGQMIDGKIHDDQQHAQVVARISERQAKELTDLRAQLARCRAALERLAYVGVICGKCGKRYARCRLCGSEPHTNCETGPLHSADCILASRALDGKGEGEAK